MLKGGAQEVARQVQGQHHKRDQQPKEDKGQSLAWGNVENAITGIGRPTDGTLWGVDTPTFMSKAEESTEGCCKQSDLPIIYCSPEGQWHW